MTNDKTINTAASFAQGSIPKEKFKFVQLGKILKINYFYWHPILFLILLTLAFPLQYAHEFLSLGDPVPILKPAKTEDENTKAVLNSSAS